MRFIWYIHALRFLVLLISVIAFICHLSQCILLNAYREKTGIPDWLTAGRWQYLTWYISLCLSLAGSIAICLNATWLRRPTRYFLDKCIGSLVILPVLASIITATLFESIEPWTDGHVKVERSGLLNSCYLLDSTRDKHYPMLYQRCMLSDTTWICAIFLCINWAILVAFVMFVTKKCNDKSTSSTVAVAKNAIRPAAAEEPKWGRYIPDPPSSIYSATTLGNRSGLLTPSSTLTRDKHSEFYYNCAYSRESMPSLPQSSPYREYSSDYLLKGGDYLSTKSSDFYDNHTTTSNSKPSSAYYYGERSPSSSYYYKYSSERYHGSGGKRGVERRGEETYDNDRSDDDDHGDDNDHDNEEYDVNAEEERQDDRYSYRYNSSKPLRVNTAYHSPSSYSADKELESATTTVTTTPLYLKFSSKSPTFDLLSDKKYNSYY